MTPAYEYEAARWWEFVHIGIPIFVLAGFFWLMARLMEWREDCEAEHEGSSLDALFTTAEPRDTPLQRYRLPLDPPQTPAGSQPQTGTESKP